MQCDDNDDDLVMFDKPKKVNMHKQAESIAQIENFTSNENSSQTIIDDSDNSEVRILSMQSEKDFKETSISQVIETESENLEDVSFIS